MIDGMFCGGCAATLEHRLASLPGVEQASVDLASGAALLRWHPGEADRTAAFQLVASLGYHARQPDEEPGKAARNNNERSLQLDLIIALFFGMWAMLPSIGLYLDAAPTPRIANGLAWAAAIASVPVIVYSGRAFYVMAWSTLRAGAAGIDALVALGVLGAVVLSAVSLAQGGAEVYFEVAIALITAQLLARLIQLKLARAGRDAVARLLDLAPPRVARITDDGFTEIIAVSAVGAGDLLLVEAGETVAVDGVVDSADVQVDRSLLSGESSPVRLVRGDDVCAGEVVADGPLRLRVTVPAGERRIDQLSRQVRSLLMQKPDWQRAVDTVARYFLLLAAAAAALGAALAALAGGDAVAIAERALAVFVIACPCALSLAAPLAGLGATRRAADSRILLRDLRVLTWVKQIDRLFVDKTGTLTQGRPAVTSLLPVDGTSDRELLAAAALVEKESRHPYAAAIVDAARAMKIAVVDDRDDKRRTVVGGGVQLESGNGTLRVGSSEWLAAEGISVPQLNDAGATRVWVSTDHRVLGAIDLDDPLRAGAVAAINALKRSGIQVTMLSGDAEAPVARLARQLGIEGVARCSPEDKVRAIEAANAQGAVTAFVGDGLNDAPAIAAAEFGVAVENAVDSATTASAATLVHGGVERVPELLSLVRSSSVVLRQNIVWAVLYNAVAVPAALVGWVHPAVAAIAMAASSISIVLNSARIRRSGSREPDPAATAPAAVAG